MGRPNVGKSTLFNRIVGRPLAIIEDSPGTTRDRVYATVTWSQKDFELVDTGGLILNPKASMDQKVKEQVESALEEADVTLFLVDVSTGILPADIEIADVLRRSAKPVFLVANKADNEKRQAESTLFYEIGIGDPVPISAYHGTGVGNLLDLVTEELLPAPPATEPEMPKIAIVGRPNVGKSLLLNALLGQERVIVSETPGTTRDAIDTIFYYDSQPLLLIDTAGIRRRGKIVGGVERYSVLRTLRAIHRSDVVLLIIDAVEGLTSQDTHIAGQIWETYKGMVVVVNKCDLMGGAIDTRSFARTLQHELKFANHVPIVFTSAMYGEGIDKLLPAATKILKERFERIATSPLNELISQSVMANSPPPIRGKRLNIFFTTQAEVNPPTFVFFVNNPALLHFSYRRYLENRLREAFGFDGSPLRLIFRAKGGKAKA